MRLSLGSALRSSVAEGLCIISVSFICGKYWLGLVTTALLALARRAQDAVSSHRPTGIARPKHHTFVLESIKVSHFVEKVRWCMQRSGAVFTEVLKSSALVQTVQL